MFTKSMSENSSKSLENCSIRSRAVPIPPGHNKTNLQNAFRRERVVDHQTITNEKFREINDFFYLLTRTKTRQIDEISQRKRVNR